MAPARDKPVTTAMEGGGFYNRNSAMQAAGIAAVLPLWRRVARSVPADGAPLVVADYGCSQGRNSMAPMRIAVEALRESAGQGWPVEVFHVDRPSNDFGSLFTALSDEPDSYLTGAAGVYPAAIGRSYFEPVLPPGSVHLGWNSWTLHWLSRSAGNVPDHLFAWMSAAPEPRVAVAAQLAADWTSFLSARGRELRPGAKLLCLLTARDGEKAGWEWLGGELWAAILDAGDAGLITAEEQLRMTAPSGRRSLSEIEAPFAIGGRFAGLEIEHAEIVAGADPFWEGYEKGGGAAALGMDWSNMMRAVLGPTILGAIDPVRDRTAVTDAIFARYAERLAAHPQRHEHYFAVVVLAKPE